MINTVHQVAAVVVYDTDIFSAAFTSIFSVITNHHRNQLFLLNEKIIQNEEEPGT